MQRVKVTDRTSKLVMGENFSNSSDDQHSLQDATGVIALDYSAWRQEQNLAYPYLGVLHPWSSGKAPRCVALPETTAQLAAVMTYCAAQKWRVVPCGNGTKLDWGGVISDADVLISTARLNQIVEHCVGDLTVTAAAGVRFADLQQTLGGAGQFWAIDPTFGTQATIGGILATADTNTLRHRYNNVRDMVLGIEFVRADGAISHAGGRVVKNVAGYDLMKLLTGSYGTLGIITEVTLRLYPVLGTTRTLLLTGAWQNLAQLRRLVARSGLSPVVMALVNAQMWHTWQEQGWQESIGQQAGIVVQFAGLANSVQQQQDELAQLATAHNLQVTALDYPTVASLTEHLQQVLWQSWGDSSDTELASGIWCKVGILPEQISLVMPQWDNLFGNAGYRALINSSSGLGTLHIKGEVVQSHSVDAMGELLLKARAQAVAAEGFLTILRSSIAYKQAVEPWGYDGGVAVMSQIRQKFDPERLLSYGRLFAEH